MLQTVCRLAGLEREAFFYCPFFQEDLDLSSGYTLTKYRLAGLKSSSPAVRIFVKPLVSASCWLHYRPLISCLWAWVLRSVLEKTPLKLPYKLETLKRESSRPRAWSALVPLELQAVPLEQRHA